MHRYLVLVPLPFDKAFDYLAPDDLALEIGDYVRVPFGSREVYGVVWGNVEAGITNQESEKKLKNIIARADHLPPMPDALRNVIDWVAWYTLAPKGNVLKMAMSVPDALHPPATFTHYTLAEGAKLTTAARYKIGSLLADGFARTSAEIAKEAGVAATTVKGMLDAGLLVSHEVVGTAALPRYSPRLHSTLSPLQTEAAENLAAKLGEGFSVTVLDGVTGSGKTEVYFETIDKLLRESDAQILVLLPEIALSVQWLQRFQERFGDVPHLWHSGVTPARKRETWRAVTRGEARLVVGARSALFLPFRNLQLMVVDEEHEHSYKQEEGVIYQARDMAVMRAQKERCPIVLVSATPSLETVVNMEQQKYTHLHLPSRHGGAAMPDVSLIDLRQNRPPAEHWISEPLKKALHQVLENGNQGMLFINRRGFAPLVICRSCGHRFGCPHCSAWLVEHKKPPRLQCHHCDYRTPPPAHCPECGTAAEDALYACGPGVERLAEEAARLFPDARVGLMTSDSLPTPDATEKLIGDVESGAVNLLIGTQMMAKGHHFPNLALVGVIDADLGLAGGDLRAAERSWQLLHQLSGRAGRAAVKGHVYLQTYNPDHAVMQALLHSDRDNFIAAEKMGREQAGMPPFGRLAGLIIEGKNETDVQAACRMLTKAAPQYRGMQLFGPAPAPLTILRGKFRYRLLLKTAREVNLPRLLREWLEPIKLPSTIRLKVDVDPYSFM